MTNYTSILFLFLCILFPVSCFGQDRLKEKADSALVFCQENKMNTEYCILVDMKMHSGKKRFFVWDFKGDSIRLSSLCAHGYGGSSTEADPVFSNVSGSYCTSLGKYKIGICSYSKWGINVHYKLHGLEATNSNAYNRIIVLHSHHPITPEEIYPYHLPLGYSQGCPVIDNQSMKKLDEMFRKEKRPTLLWIYY
ncbi:murein L,D-transpeptidase catalytic domain-containing protein [Parabacteroides sp. PH5-16]|uniref:murein L,D-transpeptidase catalytic domain-containing protein n=1 Tax=Parabacteroides sp. PH5-16 TaxID=2940625 RepID=UPI0038B3E75A